MGFLEGGRLRGDETMSAWGGGGGGGVKGSHRGIFVGMSGYVRRLAECRGIPSGKIHAQGNVELQSLIYAWWYWLLMLLLVYCLSM